MSDLSPLRFGSSAPFSFVACLFDWYTVWTLGGCVCVLPEEVRKDVALLENYYRKHALTAGFLSPRVLRLFSCKGGAVRRIITGSERVSDLYSPDYEIVNCYAQSETIVTTAFKIDKPYGNTPIGKPLEGVEVFLLDENGKEAPNGEEGEICVRGDFAKGYRNLPELTAKIFVADGDKTLVHTGDVGKRLPDGNLLYVNRRDWLAKINGQRVEPGEIEAALNALPGIDRSVVKAFSSPAGTAYLCAYYTAKEAQSERALRKALAQKLPSYMIPSYFVKLGAIPANANGKTDRNALQPPAAGERGGYTEPATETERLLAEAFSEILGCGTVGADDDFFALGGDSIGAMRLQTRCKTEGLSVSAVFEGRTPRKIAALLSRAEGFYAAAAKRAAVPSPLSAEQLGVYVACVKNPQGTMYNNPLCYELPKAIDEAKLLAALEKAFSVHPALNARVGSKNGAPCLVEEPAAFRSERLFAEAGGEARAMAEFVRPFDLEKAGFYRVALLHCGEKRYLLLDFHHLVSDGTSLGVLCEDVSRAYRGEEPIGETYSALLSGAAEEIAQTSEQYARAREYFSKFFDGAELSSEMIADGFEARTDDKPAEILEGELQGLTVAEVEKEAERGGATEGSFFLAAYEYALAKFIGEKEIVVYTAHHGRDGSGLDRSVGMFVKTLPLFVSVDETEETSAFVAKADEGLRGAISHDLYPFHRVAEEYGLSAEFLFVYQSDAFNSLSLGDEVLPLRAIPVKSALSKLNLMVFKSGESYSYRCSYRSDLYRKEIVASFLRLFGVVLRGFLKGGKLKDLPLMEEAELEKAAVLGDSLPLPDCSVADLFERRAKAAPNSPALVFEGKTYAYGELNDLSDRLAAEIGRRGVGKGDFVPVLIGRNEFMAIASLGVLKSGAAYQPLDPSYPAERLSFMAADSKARLLICDRGLQDLLPDYGGETIFTDEIFALPEGAPAEPPCEKDAMILLYTSGSTGTPKGCVLEHGCLVSFIEQYVKYFGLGPSSRVAAYASYGFDACMMDMYPTFAAGGTLYILSEEIRLDLYRIGRFFEENRITNAFMTTQVGRAFAASMRPSSLKTLAVGGERLAPVAPPEGYDLYNAYGPTECTVFSNVYKVDKECLRVPIGRPVAGIAEYALDGEGRRLPVGAVGELYIAGRQVSREYLGRPEKTAEVFLANPFSSDPRFRRMYRTGDAVRFLPEGYADFVGRKDGQVKIRGFRIELTEVESALRAFPGVKDAAVIAVEAAGGGKELAAFLTADRPIDLSALKERLAKEKPPYMIPPTIAQIDAIPLNVNGKVDRKKLLALKPKTEKKQRAERPATYLEEKISGMAKEILGDLPDPAENLIAAGLNSISLLRLAVEIHKTFGYECNVKKMMEGASVLSLVSELEEFLCSRASSAAAPAAREKKNRPLSASQTGVYVDAMKRPDSTYYNIPFRLLFPADMDGDRLAESVKKALAAHPYLATSVVIKEGEIMQRYVENFDPPISRLSMTEKEAEEYAAGFVRPFALTEPPLFRVALVKTEKYFRLFADFHHLIFDGASADLLFKQIKTAYEGGEPQREEYTYFDYVAEEEEAKRSDGYREDEAFFAEMLKDCEAASELPPDLPRSGKEGRLAETFLPFDFESAEAFSKQYGVSPAALCLAATGYAIARFTGGRTAYLNTISNGRSNLKTAGSFGMFVHTLPVAVSFSDGGDVLGFLQKTRDVLHGAIVHERYSYAELCKKYRYAPDVMYEYQLGVLDELTVAGRKIAQEPFPLGEPKFKLAVHIETREGKPCVTVQYDDSLYTRDLMDVLARSVKNAIANMLADVRAPISGVSLLDGEETATLDRFALSRTGEIPEKLLHGLFERQADKSPDKTALIACDGAFTYRELEQRANAVANELLRLGFRRNKRVAVLLPRTSKAIVCMLGVLKAGAAFIPVSPTYPEERVRLILQDSEADYVVAEARLAKDYPNGLDADLLLSGGNFARPKTDVRPDSLAYLIYTSGSTGRPKGVMLRHIGIANYLTAVAENLQVRLVKELGSVYGALTTFAFDMSLKETFLSLCNGLTLALADDEQVVNPVALTRFFRENKVDVCNATPSRLLQYAAYEPFIDCLAQCKVILSGGEKYPESLLRLLQERTNARILNTYGPTEITVSSNVKELTHERTISVGRPLYNYKEYIVDCDDNRLPVGVTGELLIGGVGVAVGYNRLEEQTAKAFVSYRGERVYRSGDYAKWTKEGDVVILGRTDAQVKLRGLRVELGEVESCLAAVKGVRRAAALIRKVGESEALCGYYTAEAPIDENEIKQELSRKLTEYMVPQYFVYLKELPLTPNGKVNVKSLPLPAAETREGISPRTERETLLCKIFAEIVKRDVFIDDNFFEIGGTSLTATRIIIEADKHGVTIAYGDVFRYPTPRLLAQFLEGSSEEKWEFDDKEPYDYSAIDRLLSTNDLEHFRAGKPRKLQNILLTGAGGYLGIHILREFLASFTGDVYCLLRGKHGKSAAERLSSLFFYYFEQPLSKYAGRVRVVEGDVTSKEQIAALSDLPVDTVVNCAANVKHFSEKTDIEDVNYYGVLNLIELCKKKGCRFVQVSTMSVAGVFLGEAGKVTELTENMLYFGQKQVSKYTHSKFLAERAVLQAAAEGLEAKIMRVGTLAPRESDGEYQINFLTNTFMGRLRSACLIGAYPYDSEEQPFELSPIDCVARAILLLSETPKECVVFHPFNNHTLLMGDLYRELSAAGLPCRPVEREEYEKLLEEAKQNENVAKVLSSMIAYENMGHGRRTFSVKKSNRYTMQALYRLGFRWPAASPAYFGKFIRLLKELGYFDLPQA